MPILTLFAIAVALAMDAFAVALATGVCLRRADAGQTLRMAGAFGLFQALMPVAGWLLGLTMRRHIEVFDHWLAFGLLALVSGKMIWEGLRGDEDGHACQGQDPTRGAQLLLLAVATSIDALAVGLSFAMLGQDVWLAALIIGVVCFVITALGVKIGGLAGRFSATSRFAELLGGATLIGIGVKILYDHQTFAL